MLVDHRHSIHRARLSHPDDKLTVPKIEDIEACEQARMTPYVPRPQRGPSVKAGLFRKDEFVYDPASNSFRCPGGQRLEEYSSSPMRELTKINYVNKAACSDCA